MSQSPFSSPEVESFADADISLGIPEIATIHYDTWVLRLHLTFDTVREPRYVDFESIRGFRVLDEGDLTEFWDPSIRRAGWLWRVRSGGWLALEGLRPGFISGMSPDAVEYLVLGANECVSVIAHASPKVRVPV